MGINSEQKQNSTAIDAALNDCLDLVLNDQATIEVAVNRYPQFANELLPLLKTAVYTTQAAAAIQVPNAFQIATHNQIMAQVSKQRSQRISWWQSILRSPQARLAIAVIAVFFVLAGTIVPASAAALPDDPILYNVKLEIEQTQLLLAYEPTQKAALYLDFAARRLQEIEIYRQQKREINAAMLDRLEDTTREAAGLIQQNKSVILAERLEQLSQAQVALLNQLPANQDVQEALDAANEGQTIANNVIRSTPEQNIAPQSTATPALQMGTPAGTGTNISPNENNANNVSNTTNTPVVPQVQANPASKNTSTQDPASPSKPSAQPKVTTNPPAPTSSPVPANQSNQAKQSTPVSKVNDAEQKTVSTPIPTHAEQPAKVATAVKTGQGLAEPAITPADTPKSVPAQAATTTVSQPTPTGVRNLENDSTATTDNGKNAKSAPSPSLTPPVTPDSNSKPVEQGKDDGWQNSGISQRTMPGANSNPTTGTGQGQGVGNSQPNSQGQGTEPTPAGGQQPNGQVQNNAQGTGQKPEQGQGSPNGQGSSQQPAGSGQGTGNNTAPATGNDNNTTSPVQVQPAGGSTPGTGQGSSGTPSANGQGQGDGQQNGSSQDGKPTPVQPQGTPVVVPHSEQPHPTAASGGKPSPVVTPTPPH